MPFNFRFPFAFDDHPISKGGPLMALTDAEQQEVLDTVRAIRDQLGPTLPGWPSLGKNAAGQELTWRDAFGVVKADITALANKFIP